MTLLHSGICITQPANDPIPVSVKPRAPIPRREALTRFPIGFTVWKDFGGGLRLENQMYHCRDRYWRVRYSDQNWEELTCREMEHEAIISVRRGGEDPLLPFFDCLMTKGCMGQFLCERLWVLFEAGSWSVFV